MLRGIGLVLRAIGHLDLQLHSENSVFKWAREHPRSPASPGIDVSELWLQDPGAWGSAPHSRGVEGPVVNGGICGGARR